VGVDEGDWAGQRLEMTEIDAAGGES
jgi:hypothetical protein